MNDYWIRQRENGIFYVAYKPNQWRSTGKRDEREAIRWAELNREQKPTTDITLSEFTRYFFIPGKCTHTDRMIAKGHTYHSTFWQDHRARLVNYILPQFGKLTLNAIDTEALDNWLMAESLSAGWKEKMIACLRKIFTEAERKHLIDKNPVNGIETFLSLGKIRKTLTMDELYALFPRDREELLRIWQSQMWVCFFMAQASTGIRPAEVAALKWEDWHRSLHGFIVKRSYENASKTLKGLKTEKRGVKKHPSIVTDRLTQELLLLESKSDHEFIFRINGTYVQADTSNKHFKGALNRAGIDRGERTQYSLRHSWQTHALEYLFEHEIQPLFGHANQMTRQYDKRTDEAYIRAVVLLKEKIEKFRGF